MKQIYLHGLGQTPASWEPVLRRLGAPADRICPDLVEMAAAGGSTYSALYRSFARLCDSLGAPLALCGLSLGGVLALHYAAERPKRVASLVLIAPQYRPPKQLLRVQNALFRLMPRSAFRQTGFSKEQLIRLCGSMAGLDLGGMLPRISCPTLVLCGSRDRANRRACRELSELLNQVELRTVAGGHELNREAPEQLASLLRTFYSTAQLSPPGDGPTSV